MRLPYVSVVSILLGTAILATNFDVLHARRRWSDSTRVRNRGSGDGGLNPEAILNEAMNLAVAAEQPAPDIDLLPDLPDSGLSDSLTNGGGAPFGPEPDFPESPDGGGDDLFGQVPGFPDSLGDLKDNLDGGLGRKRPKGSHKRGPKRGHKGLSGSLEGVGDDIFGQEPGFPGSPKGGIDDLFGQKPGVPGSLKGGIDDLFGQKPGSLGDLKDNLNGGFGKKGSHKRGPKRGHKGLPGSQEGIGDDLFGQESDLPGSLDGVGDDLFGQEPDFPGTLDDLKDNLDGGSGRKRPKGSHKRGPKRGHKGLPESLEGVGDDIFGQEPGFPGSLDDLKDNFGSGKRQKTKAKGSYKQPMGDHLFDGQPGKSRQDKYKLDDKPSSGPQSQTKGYAKFGQDSSRVTSMPKQQTEGHEHGPFNQGDKAKQQRSSTVKAQDNADLPMGINGWPQDGNQLPQSHKGKGRRRKKPHEANLGRKTHKEDKSTSSHLIVPGSHDAKEKDNEWPWTQSKDKDQHKSTEKPGQSDSSIFGKDSNKDDNQKSQIKKPGNGLQDSSSSHGSGAHDDKGKDNDWPWSQDKGKSTSSHSGLFGPGSHDNKGKDDNWPWSQDKDKYQSTKKPGSNENQGIGKQSPGSKASDNKWPWSKNEKGKKPGSNEDKSPSSSDDEDKQHSSATKAPGNNGSPMGINDWPKDVNQPKKSHKGKGRRRKKPHGANLGRKDKSRKDKSRKDKSRKDKSYSGPFGPGSHDKGKDNDWPWSQDKKKSTSSHSGLFDTGSHDKGKGDDWPWSQGKDKDQQQPTKKPVSSESSAFGKDSKHENQEIGKQSPGSKGNDNKWPWSKNEKDNKPGSNEDKSPWGHDDKAKQQHSSTTKVPGNGDSLLDISDLPQHGNQPRKSDKGKGRRRKKPFGPSSHDKGKDNDWPWSQDKDKSTSSHPGSVGSGSHDDKEKDSNWPWSQDKNKDQHQSTKKPGSNENQDTGKQSPGSKGSDNKWPWSKNEKDNKPGSNEDKSPWGHNDKAKQQHSYTTKVPGNGDSPLGINDLPQHGNQPRKSPKGKGRRRKRPFGPGLNDKGKGTSSHSGPFGSDSLDDKGKGKDWPWSQDKGKSTSSHPDPFGTGLHNDKEKNNDWPWSQGKNKDQHMSTRKPDSSESSAFGKDSKHENQKDNQELLSQHDKGEGRQSPGSKDTENKWPWSKNEHEASQPGSHDNKFPWGHDDKYKGKQSPGSKDTDDKWPWSKDGHGAAGQTKKPDIGDHFDNSFEGKLKKRIKDKFTKKEKDSIDSPGSLDKWPWSKDKTDATHEDNKSPWSHDDKDKGKQGPGSKESDSMWPWSKDEKGANKPGSHENKEEKDSAHMPGSLDDKLPWSKDGHGSSGQTKKPWGMGDHLDNSFERRLKKRIKDKFKSNKKGKDSIDSPGSLDKKDDKWPWSKDKTDATHEDNKSPWSHDGKDKSPGSKESDSKWPWSKDERGANNPGSHENKKGQDSIDSPGSLDKKDATHQDNKSPWTHDDKNKGSQGTGSKGTDDKWPFSKVEKGTNNQGSQEDKNNGKQGPGSKGIDMWPWSHDSNKEKGSTHRPGSANDKDGDEWPKNQKGKGKQGSKGTGDRWPWSKDGKDSNGLGTNKPGSHDDNKSPWTDGDQDKKSLGSKIKNQWPWSKTDKDQKSPFSMDDKDRDRKKSGSQDNKSPWTHGFDDISSLGKKVLNPFGNLAGADKDKSRTTKKGDSSGPFGSNVPGGDDSKDDYLNDLFKDNDHKKKKNGPFSGSNDADLFAPFGSKKGENNDKTGSQDNKWPWSDGDKDKGNQGAGSQGNKGTNNKWPWLKDTKDGNKLGSHDDKSPFGHNDKDSQGSGTKGANDKWPWSNNGHVSKPGAGDDDGSGSHGSDLKNQIMGKLKDNKLPWLHDNKNERDSTYRPGSQVDQSSLAHDGKDKGKHGPGSKDTSDKWPWSDGDKDKGNQGADSQGNKGTDNKWPWLKDSKDGSKLGSHGDKSPFGHNDKDSQGLGTGTDDKWPWSNNGHTSKKPGTGDDGSGSHGSDLKNQIMDKLKDNTFPWSRDNKKGKDTTHSPGSLDDKGDQWPWSKDAKDSSKLGSHEDKSSLANDDKDKGKHGPGSKDTSDKSPWSKDFKDNNKLGSHEDKSPFGSKDSQGPSIGMDDKWPLSNNGHTSKKPGTGDDNGSGSHGSDLKNQIMDKLKDNKLPWLHDKKNEKDSSHSPGSLHDKGDKWPWSKKDSKTGGDGHDSPSHLPNGFELPGFGSNDGKSSSSKPGSGSSSDYNGGSPGQSGSQEGANHKNGPANSGGSSGAGSSLGQNSFGKAGSNAAGSAVLSTSGPDSSADKKSSSAANDDEEKHGFGIGAVDRSAGGDASFGLSTNMQVFLSAILVLVIIALIVVAAVWLYKQHYSANGEQLSSTSTATGTSPLSDSNSDNPLGWWHTPNSSSAAVTPTELQSVDQA